MDYSKEYRRPLNIALGSVKAFENNRNTTGILSRVCRLSVCMGVLLYDGLSTQERSIQPIFAGNEIPRRMNPDLENKSEEPKPRCNSAVQKSFLVWYGSTTHEAKR